MFAPKLEVGGTGYNNTLHVWGFKYNNGVYNYSKLQLSTVLLFKSFFVIVFSICYNI